MLCEIIEKEGDTNAWSDLIAKYHRYNKILKGPKICYTYVAIYTININVLTVVEYSYRSTHIATSMVSA